METYIFLKKPLSSGTKSNEYCHACKRTAKCEKDARGKYTCLSCGTIMNKKYTKEK